MPDAPAGIKDVARAAGVSPATVSRVLGSGPVSEELRAKVEEAVKATGYRPNLSARRLRSQNTRTIGLIVADIRNPFFTAVSRVVEDLAYAKGMRVVLCNTDENPEREAFYLRSMQEERVTGLIATPTRAMLERLQKVQLLDLPMILVDRTLPQSRFDSVIIDNQQAASQLIDHLVATGRRRIAGIFGSSSSTGQERYVGYCTALRKHGLETLGHLVRPYALEAERLFAEIWQTHRPDAIIASNSVLATGLLRAVHALGLRVPQDLALAAFDDEPWTSLVNPGLTVVAQPVDQIGHEAMSLLFDRIRTPAAPPRIVQLTSRLIIRGSSDNSLSE